MKPIFEELARSLARAWSTNGSIALPADEAAPHSRSQAFAIQERMLELIGDRRVGWKVGAAVPAVQIREGHDGPVIGCLLAQRLFTSPAQLPAASTRGGKVESEIAFSFTLPVPARTHPYTRAELVSNLVLHAGLEMTGSRYVSSAVNRRVTTYDAIADNGSCCAYVVSAGVHDWQGIDLARLPIDARIDDGEPITRLSGELYRDPVDILVEVVNGLSERGIGLAPGDLLTTGALTLPTPLQAGQTYVARFGDFATLSVRLL
jgi:2-keto-4-pentenoate hydratase